MLLCWIMPRSRLYILYTKIPTVNQSDHCIFYKYSTSPSNFPGRAGGADPVELSVLGEQTITIVVISSAILYSLPFMSLLSVVGVFGAGFFDAAALKIYVIKTITLQLSKH